MTFVGKILVIAIMAFALVFLGMSTVVFTTSKNWMVATKNEQTKVEDLKKKLNDAQAASEAAKKTLEDAKGQFDQEKKTLENSLGARRTTKQAKPGADHRPHEASWPWPSRRPRARSKKSKRSGSETNLLRTQLSAVEKQANEFKLNQADLNDKIRELDRVSSRRRPRTMALLRETVAKFSTLLTKNGLSTTSARSRGSRARRR